VLVAAEPPAGAPADLVHLRPRDILAGNLRQF
jgi:hypothetical protein